MEINSEMGLFDDSPVKKKGEKRMWNDQNHVLFIWTKQQTIVQFLGL